MSTKIEPLSMVDLDEVLALWRSSPGVGLNESDTPECLAIYLERNPGLSLVARREGQVIGAVLCGHDGRRGYLQHLAVCPACRGNGLGRRLVENCLARLAALGIRRCNIFVYVDNLDGQGFWHHLGWNERPELRVMQTPTA